MRKKGLGKGLDALIGSSKNYDGYENVRNIEDIKDENTDSENSNVNVPVLEIDINKVEPNPNQPRRNFDDNALKELAESICEYGILQPLLVQRNSDNINEKKYTIIAGERRWRAAKLAGLEFVPVIIRDLDKAATLQIALIENIQREDLNPIEEALCYRRLIDEFDYTQESLAKKIGKSRSHISNLVRLLLLDARIQKFLEEGKLALGHIKPLLPVGITELQYTLAEKMIENDLNVREAEKLVKDALAVPTVADSENSENLEDSEKTETENQENQENKNEAQEIDAQKYPDSGFSHLAKDLQTLLGTKIHIKDSKNGGRIEISYYSPEDLDRIITIIKNQREKPAPYMGNWR
ncbi:MAG: ParB/RepB/Spo0J family partition protein [Defluviitaleaceae bacterium]|nr:ParB/RepB/Spo0J family partition protein [Defluviitaleaceae bacterium]